MLGTLGKSEAQLPPSKRRLLAQQKKTVSHIMDGWEQDAKKTISAILDIAEQHSPKKKA